MSEIAFLTPDDRPAPSNAVGRAFTWAKGHERPVLLAGVAIQAAVLLSMIATHAATLTFGETVLVRVQPVDPRDLFRGDYVILSYAFSRVPPEGIEGLGPMNDYQQARENNGRTVYVSLVPEGDGKHMKAGKMSLSEPQEGTYLRGRIAGWNQIEYGLESYFVQEGRGLEYEDAVRKGQLSAELAVTSSGKAALRGLHIADSPPPQADATANAVAEEAEEGRP